MSKRERYVALATLIVLALLGLDRFLLTPLEERRAAMATQGQRAVEDLERARALFARSQQLAPEWRRMLGAGLKFGPGEAEGVVLRAVRNWSEEAGLSLSSLRPDQATEVGDLRQITFRASAQGRMSAIAGFLWRLETSPLPVRVAELHIGARKEGTDDLSMQLLMSALCQAADARPEAVPARAPAQDEVKSGE